MNLQDVFTLIPQIFQSVKTLEQNMSLLIQRLEELLSLQNQLIAQKTPSSSQADLLEENAQLKQKDLESAKQIAQLEQDKVDLAGKEAASETEIEALQKNVEAANEKVKDAERIATEAQNSLKSEQDMNQQNANESVLLQAKIASAAAAVAAALAPTPVVTPQQDVPVDQSEHQQAAVQQAADTMQSAPVVTPQSVPDGTVVTTSNQPSNPLAPVLNSMGSGAVDSPTSSPEPITSANPGSPLPNITDNAPSSVESSVPNTQPNDTQTIPHVAEPVKTVDDIPVSETEGH